MRINKNFTLFYLVGLSISLSAENESCYFSGDAPLKIAKIPNFQEAALSDEAPTVRVSVNFSDTLAPVPEYIYGNNANVYSTQMITHPNWIADIRRLSPNVLRYPGGNLSNMFFWDARPDDLPKDIPDQLVWDVAGELRQRFRGGRNNADGALSIDNYYKMLEQTQSTGMFTVNYAYARYGTGPDPVAQAAHYAADWVRYDNGRTQFWEIGNENYGAWQAGYLIDTLKNQDGQPAIISGELYGKHFLIFADSMRSAAKEVGADIEIGVVLLEEDQDWHPPVQKAWNSGIFKQIGNEADFFIVHSYYTPWNENSTVATILNSAASTSEHMMTFMKNVAQTNGVDMKPLALTEWNIFAIGSMQQVSFVSGMHAILVLGELMKNKFSLACRWNLANAWANGDDHGLFSQNGEPDVPRFKPRPAYHYLTVFQQFFGDHMVNATVSGEKDVVAYASRFQSGEAGIALVNKDPERQIVELQLNDFKTGSRCYWYALTGGDDHGDFSRRVFINGMGPDLPAGGPDLELIKANSSKINGNVALELPGYGTVVLLVEGK